ncbi:MAG: glycosyltransferase family 2 protein [Ruminococcaceae bacterium]|nr:glycosyltransferase family 2 protein [Oscillospiraceae bacterium]
MVGISVIMPVYNPEPSELKRALSSVLSQSMGDFELVICDDCSKPYVHEIISECNDERIVYLRNERNGGCAYSLNRCIEAARGELLIRQDADDYSLPERFAVLKDAYERTGADIIATNILLFDESGEWGHRDYPEKVEKRDFLFAVPFMHGACALKKSSVAAAGMYPVSRDTARCEEYALFMTMFASGARGINLPKRLYAFNENRAAISRRRYSDKVREVKVKARGFRELGLYPRGIVYLAKPLIVGLIPPKLLARIKDKVFDRRDE